MGLCQFHIKQIEATDIVLVRPASVGRLIEFEDFSPRISPVMLRALFIDVHANSTDVEIRAF